MKKVLLLAGVLGVLSVPQVFAQEAATAVDVQPKVDCVNTFRAETDCISYKKMHRGHDFKKQFEERLQLTEDQKAQAKTLREKEAEQLKPIFEKIKVKHDEEKEIMNKRLTFDERQAELAPIRKELHQLRGEIFKVRAEGKKDFEAILTTKQLDELKKMKADARKNFKRHGRRGGFHHRPMPMPQCNCGCGCARGPKPPVDKQF